MTTKPDYSELQIELDSLLDKLQQDDISVEDALKAYERGMELVGELERVLSETENKITKLKKKFDA
jgi:exodeoxyribonuclease VII small subunit